MSSNFKDAFGISPSFAPLNLSQMEPRQTTAEFLPLKLGSVSGASDFLEDPTDPRDVIFEGHRNSNKA